MTTNPELDRWNERFSSNDYLFGTAPNAFLVRQRHLLRPGAKALAIADGEGRNGVWLAEQGLDVLSIDFSPVALDKARRLAASRGVALRTWQVNLEDWDWEAEWFDVVAAVFVQFAPPRTSAPPSSRASGGHSRRAACSCSRDTAPSSWPTGPAVRHTRKTCTPPRCSALLSPGLRSSISRNTIPSSPRGRGTMAYRPWSISSPASRNGSPTENAMTWLNVG
jgi:SAM-dependent methyltransferase